MYHINELFIDFIKHPEYCSEGNALLTLVNTLAGKMFLFRLPRMFQIHLPNNLCARYRGFCVLKIQNRYSCQQFLFVVDRKLMD